MAKIIGNTTATPMAIPDWNQTDETKADYIKNKPNIDIKAYAVPSTGLEIVNGVVTGIGTCKDEYIVIPELSDGVEVIEVADGVFGGNLEYSNQSLGIKSIVFPPSIKKIGVDAVNTSSCSNLESVYIMNPLIMWDDEDETYTALQLGACVKDVYFAGSRKQWVEINTQHQKPLINLSQENIEAGIVPTMHYGYFATYSDIEEKFEAVNQRVDEAYTKEEVDIRINSLIPRATIENNILTINSLINDVSINNNILVIS
jgi:hypothetical protein